MELIFEINGKTPDPFLGIMEGFIQEGINEISSIELILVSKFQLSNEQCAEYIGQPARLAFAGLLHGALEVSRYDGLIFEFHIMDHIGVRKGMYKYQMIIRPKVWALNFNVQSRTFPGKSRIDVVEAVLGEALIADEDFKPNHFQSKIYAARDQIIQNQVSDLVFVQSLLREAGINYFFSADKSGDKTEFFKMADNNIFFIQNFEEKDDEPVKPVIPYVPDSGQAGDYRVFGMETHFRAIPKNIFAVSNTGDGKTQTFSAKKEAEGGTFGNISTFDIEGQDSEVPKKRALEKAEFFQSGRMIYEGQSNYFRFRPGEKYYIGDEYENPQTDILITSVFHHFHQKANAAVSGDNHINYMNLFSAAPRTATIRPDQTYGKTTIELKRMFSEKNSIWRKIFNIDEDENSRLEDLEKYELKKKIDDLQCELSIARDYSGVMIGEVIEDAKVTANKELVCRVKNDRFPQGLTVKISLHWITTEGWLSLLPRKGVQVYFMFLNGHGGRHDAVMVGYRPTGDHPLMDPAKDIKCPSTEPGEEKDGPAVGDTEFAPVNKWRNSLMGEKRVAEIAVIDGGEDSVYIHANKRIVANGDESVSIKTSTLTEKADSASQSFGTLTRTVSGKQKATIRDTSTWTVTNNATLESTDQDVLVRGKLQVQLIDEDQATVVVAGKDVTAMSTSETKMNITDSDLTATGKNAVVTLKENSGTLLVAADGLSVTDSNAKVASGDVYIDIQTGGKIVINGKTIEVKGSESVSVTSPEVKVAGSTSVTIEKTKTVNITGDTEVAIDGGKGTINAKGGMVKLCC